MGSAVFLANVGRSVIADLSPSASELLDQVIAADYYAEGGRGAGTGLRVPADLDESICLYQQLSPTNRARFDRAAF